MACREGINSVVISLAYFQTKTDGKNSRADDSIVKRAFHILKAEETTAVKNVHGKEPKLRIGDVIKFLEVQKKIARTDANIPDRRRQVLIEKLNNAIQQVRSREEVPTLPTFLAWQKLIPKVRELRSHEQRTFTVSKTRFSAVSRKAVDDAIQNYESIMQEVLYIQQSLDRAESELVQFDPRYLEEVNLRLAVAEAEMHTRILAYDATDAGFKELLSESDALLPYMPISITERHRIAQEERRRIFAASPEVLHSQGAKYRMLEREYVRARNMHDEKTMEKLWEPLDRARFEYSKTILIMPKMKTLMENYSDWENSPDGWQAIEDDPDTAGPTRREQWIAVELYASTRDKLLVKTGTLSEEKNTERSERRSLQRKEAFLSSTVPSP